MDIAFDETECFVCFRSDCGYVFIMLCMDCESEIKIYYYYYIINS